MRLDLGAGEPELPPAASESCARLRITDDVAAVNLRGRHWLAHNAGARLIGGIV